MSETDGLPLFMAPSQAPRSKPGRCRYGFKPLHVPEGTAQKHLARFDTKWELAPDSGCHLWTGTMNRWGYGVFNINRRVQNAHRWAYILKIGPIPEGLVVDHTCNNRRCVNPAHLRVCTQKENIHAEHSSTIAHRLSLQTHCKRGHEFTPENTTMTGKKGNIRSCRECMRMHSREFQRELRASGTLRQRAMDWMDGHPDGMALFEKFALELADRRLRLGMKAIAERVRWEFMVSRDGDDWKINNSYVSWIARELIRRHPHLAEFIELRRTKEDA